MYITDIEVNDCHKSAICKFHQFDIFKGLSFPETTLLVYGKGPAIWHGLSDMWHIQVNYIW